MDLAVCLVVLDSESTDEIKKLQGIVYPAIFFVEKEPWFIYQALLFNVK